MLHHRRPICGVDAEATLATEKKSCTQYGSVIELLLNGGFGVLLPFLPLFFRHQGLSPSEIGAIYGAGFALSCFTATLWYYIDEVYGKRKWILTASVSWWIIFVVPFAFAKDHFSLFKFKHNHTLHLNTTTNVSSSSNYDMFLNGFDVSIKYSFDWERNYFLTLFVLINIGKSLQSPTDYFTFDHEYLLRIHSTPPGASFYRISSMWAMLRTKAPQSLMALVFGYLLDHISARNPVFGNYKICFYVYASFLVFTMVLLNSASIDTTHDNNKQKAFPALSEMKQLLKPQFIILAWILICLGANRGFYTSFLCLHLRHSGASHVTVASVFAIAKASEFFFHIASVRLIKFLSSFELIFLTLVASAIRALLLSFFTDDKLVTYAVLPELLAGLSSCLLPAISLYFIEQSSNLALTLPPKIMQFLFWGLGMTIGSLGGGCLVISVGSIAVLRTMTLVSLWTGLVFVLISLDIKDPKDKKFKQLLRQRSIADSADFLLENEPLLD